jgi:hypothetical protein
MIKLGSSIEGYEVIVRIGPVAVKTTTAFIEFPPCRKITQ